MNVCIIGTARSGTTATYSLVQKILVDSFPVVDHTYEPFLWEKEVFNDMYERVNHNFDSVNNISIQGIFNHLQLPLFIDNPDDYIQNDYLKAILEADNNKARLSKFIRANGRIRLINRINPDCKIIFIIRNPLDVVNSLSNNFSFFGGEFFRDDYQRFISEIRIVFNVDIRDNESLTYLDKQLLWWKYMNLYSLKSIAGISDKTLVLCQEELNIHPEQTTRNICSFLDLPFSNSFVESAIERRSEVTRKFMVSQQEQDTISPYLEEYFMLLKEYNIPHSFDIDSITRKYDISPVDVITKHPHYGNNPLVLLSRLDTLSIENKANSRVNKILKRENERMLKEVNELKDKVLIQRKDLKKYKHDLDQIRSSKFYKLYKFLFK